MKEHLTLLWLGYEEEKINIVKLLRDGISSEDISALTKSMGMLKLTTAFPSFTLSVYEIIEVEGEFHVKRFVNRALIGFKLESCVLKIGDRITDKEISGIKPEMPQIEFLYDRPPSASLP